MKNRSSGLKAAVLASLLAGVTLAGAHGETLDGAGLYKKECGNCHGPIDPGEAGTKATIVPVMMPVFAPNLAGILGKPAGAVEDYAYSRDFREIMTGRIWDESLLDAFITDTRAMVPRSFMFYRQPDPAIRRAIIAYLKSTR